MNCFALSEDFMLAIHDCKVRLVDLDLNIVYEFPCEYSCEFVSSPLFWVAQLHEGMIYVYSDKLQVLRDKQLETVFKYSIQLVSILNSSLIFMESSNIWSCLKADDEVEDCEWVKPGYV